MPRQSFCQSLEIELRGILGDLGEWAQRIASLKTRVNIDKNRVGAAGFEPATSSSQSLRSTRLSHAPATKKAFGISRRRDSLKVAGSTGLEPATPRSTIWCSNRIELRPRSLRTGMTLPDSGRGCKHYLRVCRKKSGHFILTGFRQDSTGKHCTFVQVPSGHARCFSLCRGGGHGTPWGSCQPPVAVAQRYPHDFSA